MNGKQIAIARFALIAVVVLAVLVVAVIELLPVRIAPPKIRAEVLGPVATGTIYTGIDDASEFFPGTPHADPFLLTLSATGTVLTAEQVSTSPFAYQRLPDGSTAYAVLNSGDPLWGGTWFLRDTQGTTTIRVHDNNHTDFHAFLPAKDGRSYYVGSYKLHTTAQGLVQSYYIEQQERGTGNVLFSWDSFDHVPVSMSDTVETRPYWIQNNVNDYFHGNSLAFTNDGNLLISGRNVSQVLKVNRKTGAIMWRLGGKDSDFTFVNDPLGGFTNQHSVSMLPNGDILVYDNGNQHSPQKTRVVEYKLDLKAKTATLVWSYSDGRFTYVAGSAQRLANGDTLIGWGLDAALSATDPRITEVNASGTPVLKIFFPYGAALFSAFKQ